MSGLWQWLLDLRNLQFGQEGVEFGFERGLPAWGWALVVLAAAGAAWWSYRRLDGSVRTRTALAAVRALLLILVAVLIAGPRLVKKNEVEERDWVLVLADRSASMQIRDVAEGDDGEGARRAREEQLRAALESSRKVWQDLAAERVVVWLGFDGSAYELKKGEGAASALPVELGDPAGRRTAIGRAIDAALRRAAARPLAGVVLISDGRSIDEPGRAAMRRLQAEKVPVFSVALGSAEPVRDIGIRTVEAPKVAFVNDLVPVAVELETIGEASGGECGTIQLVDRATGLVLDERRIGDTGLGDEAAAGDDQTVTLTARPRGPSEGGVAGPNRWLVRVRPSGADLVAENNETEVALDLEDRPLRVLYFDGYPRWEYRYVKNLLLREESIQSAALLLAEGKRFVQEGDQTLLAMPASPEEWKQFDVVVIGDVRPELFTEEQLRQLREHVGTSGAGLLWIGGEGATPNAWAASPLADLLPMSVGAGGSTLVRAWGEPVLVSPAPAAERYGVLRLADGPDAAGSWWPASLADPRTGWSRLRWAQRIDPGTLKPTAEVLATARPEAVSDPTPLVMSMRFGAGRVLYVGTDEIWRWRYGRGEFLPERFWLQMVRLLGRESLARAGRSAVLEVRPRRAEVDQPVRVSAELIDQRLVDAGPTSLRARITRLPGPGEEPPAPVEVTLAPEGGGDGLGGPTRQFGSTWIPTESGRYRVEVTDPLLAGDRLEADLEVWLPDDELRHPETDHAALAALSEATGGRVLAPDQLASIPDLLPKRGVRLVGTPEQETLWDTPLALLLVLLLLTVEWVGRRLIRLV